MSKIQKFKQQVQKAYANDMLGQYLAGRLGVTYIFKLRNLLVRKLPLGIRADISNYQAYLYLRKRYLHKTRLQVDPGYERKELPKIVWWCWFQGEEKAPELAQICLASVREVSFDYKVTVVTDENLAQYIEIPENIQQKYKAGIIRPATYSDIVRLLLLAKYGGVWIDASVLCTNKRIKEVIEREPFFAFRNDVLSNNEAIRISSWFLSAVPNAPLVVDTAAMMLDYWENYDFTINYFLVHLLFSIAADRNKALWQQMPVFNNVTPHTLVRELNDKFSSQRFKELDASLGIHKLNNHRQYEIDGTLYGYLKKRYLGD